ncbi:MAG: CehA/McbA family metallohydrolase [Planctomycetes bacterium]|nr:CehA/McbA family metallohydrolase [Planctomycetota bacterium]
MKYPVLLAFASVLTGCALAALVAPDRKLNWYKGNTHTHTLNSDGDSPPGEVAHWYRDHEYDFLVISDHNYFTVITELQKEIDRENKREMRKPFLMIPGEEVTDQFMDARKKYALHVNGVATTRVVGKQGGGSVVEVLQRCIDGVLSAGGLPSVNHPNYEWSITTDDLYSLKNLQHFEIFNGHPSVNNFGGGGSPSLEEMWDALLSRGRRLFGVAVDDAHVFTKFSPEDSNPGRGWIVARAPELSQAAILEALKSGDFYASTGVELEELSTSDRTLRLKIKQREDFRYRTHFIGKDGKVLASSEAIEASYRLKEGDLYVRARVASSNGQVAWTQPLHEN